MNLSGVGEKTERKLKKIGILKAEDFLQYYPNHYEYFPVNGRIRVPFYSLQVMP